jgi:hypothetical protein
MPTLTHRTRVLLIASIALMAASVGPPPVRAQSDVPIATRQPAVCNPGSTTPYVDRNPATGGWLCTTTKRLVKTLTGIAENTATDAITVTVPAAFNGSAIIEVKIMGSLGAGGSVNPFESTKSLLEIVTVTRTSGTLAVVSTSTAALVAEAHVASGCTAVLTSGASSVAGSTGAADTFTIQLTISNNACLATNHRAIVVADLVASDPGITIK